MNQNYDVIIVGAGGAGLAAACAARSANAKTLVLERAPAVGGSTAISGGVFYAAGTSVQRQCRIDDSWVEMVRYPRPRRVPRLVEDSCPDR